MNNITKRIAIIAGISCLVVVGFLAIMFVSDDSFDREYLDDIHIQVETRQAEIIIREWRFLLGSGAEVYYKEGRKEILLGNLSGGDNGYCPFKEGQYSVEFEDNKVIIEWDSKPSNNEIPWKKEIFELPSN